MALSGAIAAGKAKLAVHAKSARDVKVGEADKANTDIAAANPAPRTGKSAKKPKPPTAPE